MAEWGLEQMLQSSGLPGLQQLGPGLIMEPVVCSSQGFWFRMGGGQKTKKRGCIGCNHTNDPSNHIVPSRSGCKMTLIPL